MKTLSLIEELLAEQQELTAVERFAQRHASSAATSGWYQDLIPLKKPRPGEQFAFRVDLDACTGCKACVSACHALNGLDEDETWRSVGLLHGGSAAQPYQQTVTAACHHCLEPACLEGCPVLAYDKDEVTGIVRHLDDQCIGCQYCLLKCPYDVPKYSAKRGIVRKCDMCYGRLVEGEPPACVQACPSQAITIRIVSKSETIVRCASEERILPGAFPSDYTKPTTSYVSHKTFPDNCESAGAGTMGLAPAHWPLVWMLILSQAAAGLSWAAWLVLIAAGTGPALGVLAVTAGSLLHVGLFASLFHLGRPLGAWRAFLGWRTSWMSREIIALALFAMLSAALAFAANYDVGGVSSLAAATVLAAFAGVGCSAMIYVDTRRPAWNPANVLTRFFGTASLLGASITACCLAWTALLGNPALAAAGRVVALLTTVIRTGLFVWEFWERDHQLRALSKRRHSFSPQAWGRLAAIARGRTVLFWAATIFGLAGVLVPGASGASCATISLLCTVASQVAERYTFFVAAVEPGMPGGVAS